MTCFAGRNPLEFLTIEPHFVRSAGSGNNVFHHHSGL